MIATTDAQALRNRALVSLGQLPPFSPILNRLLASLAQEDVSFVRIADLIEKDTVLAGNVLRLVNSALYGRRGAVNSIRHAVTLLGVNKLRNATLGMSVSRMWNQIRTPYGFSIKSFNLHSVGTAMMSDLLAQAGPVDHAEGAFAAGLFHDLGRLLIAISLPEEFDQVTRLGAGCSFGLQECERAVLGFTHAELGSDAMALWNLPGAIGIAVRYHHEPELAPKPDAPISLSRVIHAADEFINSMDYKVDASDTATIKEAARRIQGLGLDSPLPPLVETFTTEFEALRAMF